MALLLPCFKYIFQAKHFDYKHDLGTFFLCVEFENAKDWSKFMIYASGLTYACIVTTPQKLEAIFSKPLWIMLNAANVVDLSNDKA